MKKHVIEDFDSLKNYFKKIKNPFFAVNKYPYSTLIGIENFVKHFEVLTFLNTKEAEVIAKKHKISFFMEGKVKGDLSDSVNRELDQIYKRTGKDENS
ncbi:MAG: hypothetical protein AB1Z50_04720, partial [Desulfuromonadales bacterium]